MVSCSMLLFSASLWAEKSIMGWHWSFVNQEFTSLLKTWTVSLCWHVHIDLRLNVRLAISQWLTQGGHAVPPCLLTKSSIKSLMFPIHWSVVPCHTSIVCFFCYHFKWVKCSFVVQQCEVFDIPLNSFAGSVCVAVFLGAQSVCARDSAHWPMITHKQQPSPTRPNSMRVELLWTQREAMRLLILFSYLSQSQLKSMGRTQAVSTYTYGSTDGFGFSCFLESSWHHSKVFIYGDTPT